MSIKEMLGAHESEIAMVFAILVYSIIAFKVITMFRKVAKAGDVQPSYPIDSTENSIELICVDEKTGAIAMAIVAHESDVPAEELVFKSVKAID